MARHRLRLAAHIIGWILLSLAGLITSVVLAVLIVGRTDWGRQKMLATLMPVLKSSLTGELRVGKLEGDLVHMLVLRDVVLTDAEGEAAVRARRVGVSYNLLALVVKTLHLTSVDAEGVWIHARYLKDGRLNLAALTKPKEKSSPLPDLTVRLGTVRLDAEAVYDAPKVIREAPKEAIKAAAAAPEAQKTENPKELLKQAAKEGKEEAEERIDEQDARGAIQRVHLRLRARAGARIGLKTTDIDAALEQLEIETLEPARVTIAASGGYKQRGGEMLVSDVKLALRTDGDNIGRLAPAAELRGAYAVDVKADGPLSALRFEVALRPPAGALTVRGQLGATLQKLPWEITLQARDIDPHAMRADLPAGRVQLDASGKGEGPRGTVELKELLVEMLDARLRASGRGDLAGEAEGRLELKARDLGRFSRLAGVALGGDLSLTAEATRERGQLRVQADALGTELRVAEARVGRLALKARTVDLTGHVQLDARQIQAGQLRVTTLALTAAGSRDAVSLDVTGAGPDQTVVRVAARGDVLYDKDDRARKRPVGVDAVISQLALGRAGQRWQSTGPARVRVDPAVRVTGFALASGDQRLTLHEARFDPATKALLVRLNAKSLDARRIVQMVPLEGAEVPTTQIDLDVQARGTARAPVADVKVDGRAAALPLINLPALVFKLQAHYGGERVRGEVGVDTRGAKDTIKLAARFDAPVSPRAAAPLSADVEARVPLEQLHKLMPPGLEGLRGVAELNLRAGGSLRKPEVALSLRVPQWRAATLQGQGTTLTVNYKDERLAADARAGVSTTEGKRVGALELNVSAPLRLGLGVTGAEMRRALPDTPIAGKLALRRVDLGQLARALLASKPPVTAGALDVTLDLGGTVFDPTAHLLVDGRGVATPAIDQLDLALRLDYERGAARLDLKTALRGAPIVAATAGLDLPMRRVLQQKGKWYLDLPLLVDAQVVPYDVRRLSKSAAGSISGRVEVRGTMGKPLVDAQLGGERLAFQEWPIGSVAVHGAFDGERATAQVRAQEPTGGQLRADASLPLAAAQPIKVDLVAKDYRLAYEPRETPKGALRVLSGLLNADFHVDGPRAQPRPYGSLHLQQGAIAVAADPRVYRKVELDVDMNKDGLINLRKVYASAEVGWVQLSGMAKLKGLRPERGNLLLRAERFPISAGSMSLWLDAKVTVTGESRGDVFQGKVTVDSGTVHLPKIASGGKKLQSTKPLEDVDYVDYRGLSDAGRRAQQATKQEQQQKEAPPPLDELPTRAVIDIAVPGPLYVRGKEVNAEAEGKLRLELRGPLALVSGNIRVPSGWADLLGNRWNIDRATVSLDGAPEPNPILDVRVSRKMGDALVYVEVHGTALRPKVVLRSDPPIYSEAQIIAMIISGDPNSQRTSSQSLDQKAIGAVSGLIVGQIKDKLGEALPIDVLKVDVGGEGYNVFGTTRVEVGKYLTDDLYVSYSHQFGTSSGTRRMNSNQLQLEYQFLRNFALETLFGDAGIGALDFYWTRRF